METVVIVIHLMAIVALIAVVLLQRSEGGALGVGGSNQFMTTRGQGNVLTRATSILAATFFVTSLLMTVLARLSAPPTSVLDLAPAAQTAPAAVPTTVPTAAVPTTTAPAAGTATPAAGGTAAPAGGILDQLNRYTAGPSQTAPATTAPDTSTPAAPIGGTTQAPPAQ